jgi:hypothetical protein
MRRFLNTATPLYTLLYRCDYILPQPEGVGITAGAGSSSKAALEELHWRRRRRRVTGGVFWRRRSRRRRHRRRRRVETRTLSARRGRNKGRRWAKRLRPSSTTATRLLPKLVIIYIHMNIYVYVHVYIYLIHTHTHTHT